MSSTAARGLGASNGDGGGDGGSDGQLLVVFDRDGTLLDFRRMFLEFIRAIYREQRLPAPPEEQLLAFETWRGILEGSTIGEVLVRDRVPEMPERYFDHWHPYPGVRETVLRLRDAGARMVIASSWIATDATWRLLRQNGLGDCFEHVVTAEDLALEEQHHGVGHLTTKQRVIGTALERAGGHRGPTVVVGDSPEDVAAGQWLKARTVAVRTGNGTRQLQHIESLGPDWIVDSVVDVVRLLEDGSLHP